MVVDKEEYEKLAKMASKYEGKNIKDIKRSFLNIAEQNPEDLSSATNMVDSMKGEYGDKVAVRLASTISTFAKKYNTDASVRFSGKYREVLNGYGKKIVEVLAGDLMFLSIVKPEEFDRVSSIFSDEVIKNRIGEYKKEDTGRYVTNAIVATESCAHNKGRVVSNALLLSNFNEKDVAKIAEDLISIARHMPEAKFTKLVEGMKSYEGKKEGKILRKDLHKIEKEYHNQLN